MLEKRDSNNRNITKAKARTNKKRTKPRKRKVPERVVAEKKTKKRKKRKQKQQLKLIAFELIGAVLATGILLWLVSFFTFSIIKVEGYSMLPNLDENEWVLVNKLKKPRRFQLAYIKTPDGKSNTIRRIIALPGERVTYKEDQLWIDNEQKAERFIESEKTQEGSDQPRYTENFELRDITKKDTIPKGKYLVLGDNRFYATDSRKYGLIDKRDIIGIVTARLLPIHKIGHLYG